ncbi:MAG: hypothetical protein K0A99_04445 [Desulfoarculaceae bacterium]|nr:hypothetical protein [Desulfoarculaceae bacterium]
MSKFPTLLILRFILTIALPLSLAGRSSFNCTSLEKNLGAEENLITLTARITDNLTRQASPPLLPRQPDLPILVTTFVNNDNLKETSRFGRILQEQITSRLVQLDYTTKELKLRNTLLMQERSGETMLSRNTDEINAKQTLSAQAVLGELTPTPTAPCISPPGLSTRETETLSPPTTIGSAWTTIS